MIRCGRYRDLKGNEYVVMEVGIHTETGAAMVVYYDCKEPHKVWVRPLSMWNELVKPDGYEGPRFTWVESQ